MRFEIPDNRTTPVPDFKIDWLPPWAYQYVTPRIARRGDLVELEAAAYVGAIPLHGGNVLHIVPKAGRNAFSRMLLVTEGLDEALRKDLDDTVSYAAGDGAASWAKLLARRYMESLQLIEKESLLFGRKIVREWSSTSRGRLDVLPTIRAIALNQERPVRSIRRSRTYDLNENEVLAAAANALIHIGEIHESQRSIATRWVRRFGHRVSRRNLRDVVRGLRTGRYSGPRGYYVPALTMAHLILSETGIELDESDDVEGTPLMKNMNELFESYIRRLVSSELSPRGFVVDKAAGPPLSRYLFSDGTAELKPDILVSTHAGVELVADVKYKTGTTVESGDYYQLLSYLNVYKCSTGVLVMPAADHETSTTVVERKTPSSPVRVVYEVRVTLTDYSSGEEALKEAFVSALAAS